MSINRGLDKEDVVHIYNGVLAIKRNEIGSFVEMWMDLKTVIQKSESKKQISHFNAYMWNLEKWYRSSYLQSRNRDTDVENKCMDTKGEGAGGRTWEIGIDTYTLLILCVK